MAQKGLPGDALHLLVHVLGKGEGQVNRTNKIAKSLRDNGVPGQRAHKAASILVYERNRNHEKFIRQLQDWGYIKSRQIQ